MSTNQLTLGTLLGRTVTDEIIILPKQVDEQQGPGYTVYDGKVFTRSNNEEIYLAPDTTLESVVGTAPYEGVTFYRILEVGKELESEDSKWEKITVGGLLHQELLMHLKDKGALSTIFDRHTDLHGKMKDWMETGQLKELVDVIQSAAMLLHSQKHEPEIVLYDRNTELRHRLAMTGSMLRKK